MTTNVLRAILGAVLLAQASAHTWIEQLSVIEGGKFVGNYGYPRSYISRTDAGFNGGASSQWLLPPLDTGRLRVNDQDLLCRQEQRTQTQSANWPRLNVGPGDWVAMKYAENGHVTLPDNQKGKPEKGGTVFIYGTTSPKQDEKLTDVLKWTSDGTGGDKRGVLLTANNFDDGRCYQINGGSISVQRQKEFPDPNPGQPTSVNEQYCETDVQIPKDQATGKTYTLYWVWQWPTAAGADPTYPDGKDEWYTSCSDVNVVAQNSVKSFLANASQQKYALQQQDPQTEAVASYQSRTALTTDPAKGMAAASSSAATPSTPGASSAAATPSSAVTSAAASNPNGNGAADGAPQTVYVTVTAAPTSSQIVTDWVTITGPVPMVTEYMTTTMTLGAPAVRRRAFKIRPERRQGHSQEGMIIPASEQTAKEDYCKNHASDHQTCGYQGDEDEDTQRSTATTATSAASASVAAPSLLMLFMLFMIGCAFA